MRSPVGKAGDLFRAQRPIRWCGDSCDGCETCGTLCAACEKASNMRAVFVALAILGGIGVASVSYVSLRGDGSNAFDNAVLISLAGLVGALPGLTLLWLATPSKPHSK